MTRQEFAKRFAEARKQAGYSQASAAEKLEIPQPRIAEYETTRTVPSFIRIVEIIDRLGLDPRLIVPQWERWFRRRKRP